MVVSPWLCKWSMAEPNMLGSQVPLTSGGFFGGEANGWSIIEVRCIRAAGRDAGPAVRTLVRRRGRRARLGSGEAHATDQGAVNLAAHFLDVGE